MLVACLADSGGVRAQAVIDLRERLDSDRPEAWAMNYFASITLLAGLSVPHSRAAGSVEGGAEIGSIPDLSRAERTVGFDGTKEEDLNHGPLFARPRLTIGLPWRFAVTLSYLPPVRVFGLKPNLFAFALERPLYERDPVTIGLRLYGQTGSVEGAITCGEDVVKFALGSERNPYGCERKSADEARQRYAGIELSGAYRIARLGGLAPYVAVAGNRLDTRVRVHALTFGVLDRSRLYAETWTFAASTGFTYPLSDRVTLSAGMFYSPLAVSRPPATSRENDALLNLRALLTYRFW